MSFVEKENTIYHVGVSGGKDSAAALIYLTRETKIDHKKIIATFCDTGNEHAWTYEHVNLLSRTVFPIQTLNPKDDFYALAKRKKRFPSTKVRFCTQFLKIFPTRDFVQGLYDKGLSPVAVSGVRADESKERKNLPEWELTGFEGAIFCPSWRPLIRWTIDDVIALHKRQNVPMNPLYAIGAKRVGCWPCIMSRKAEIRTIALKFPERIDEIRKAEQDFEKTYGRYSSFFASKTVPARFRSKSFKYKDGHTENIATIDDVVRWAMTGKGAKGSYKDDAPEKESACNSGFCE